MPDLLFLAGGHLVCPGSVQIRTSTPLLRVLALLVAIAVVAVVGAAQVAERDCLGLGLAVGLNAPELAVAKAGGDALLEVP